MPSIAELERTKTELALALLELDKLERLSTGGLVAAGSSDQAPLDDRMESLLKTNADLKKRNVEMAGRLAEWKAEKDRAGEDVLKMEESVAKLQDDIAKISSEKALLSQIVKNTQGENEVLSKVLDKISTDYEQLKKNFDAQKCPKDDKILALRKTARALETENQLLHEEKTIIERETKRIRAELETRLAESQRQVETQTSTLQAHIDQITDLSHKLRQSDEDKQTLSFKLNSMEKELAANKTQLNKKKKK